MTEVANDAPELIQTLAHALVMARGIYPTPEEEAEALLKRLRHDGWAVIRAKTAEGKAR